VQPGKCGQVFPLWQSPVFEQWAGQVVHALCFLASVLPSAANAAVDSMTKAMTEKMSFFIVIIFENKLKYDLPE
jgi:hypothetical protein